MQAQLKWKSEQAPNHVRYLHNELQKCRLYHLNGTRQEITCMSYGISYGTLIWSQGAKERDPLLHLLFYTWIREATKWIMYKRVVFLVETNAWCISYEYASGLNSIFFFRYILTTTSARFLAKLLSACHLIQFTLFYESSWLEFEVTLFSLPPLFASNALQISLLVERTLIARRILYLPVMIEN